MADQRAAVNIKHPFIRRGFLLEDPPGLDARVTVPASLLGERLPEDQRSFWIAVVASGSPHQLEDAIHALGNDRTPEYLEALITALSNGSTVPAMQLPRFADEDPRVRATLVEALVRAPLANVCNVARAVGSVGGEGALSALRKRLDEVAPILEGPIEESISQQQLDWIVTLAHAVLCLDPDAKDAAERLVAAYRVTPGSTRWTVVEKMTEVLRNGLKTAASHMLWKEIVGLLDSRDTESFLTAAPVLAREHFDVVHKRCKDALWSAAYSWRLKTIIALTGMPFPFGGRSLATLATWLLNEDVPTREALWVAGLVHDFLDDDFTTNLLRRALESPSPSLRWDAIKYIERIAPEASNLSMLEDASAVEPDPLLERNMRRVLATRRAGSE